MEPIGLLAKGCRNLYNLFHREQPSAIVPASYGTSGVPNPWAKRSNSEIIGKLDYSVIVPESLVREELGDLALFYLLANEYLEKRTRRSGHKGMVHPTTIAERINILGYPQSYREIAFLHDLVEDVGKRVEDIPTMLSEIETRVSESFGKSYGPQVAMDVYFVTNLFDLVFKRKDKESLLKRELSQTDDERKQFVINVIATNRRAQRDFDRQLGVSSKNPIAVQIKSDLNSFYRTLIDLKNGVPEDAPWKNLGEMLYAIYCERIADECFNRYSSGDPNFDMLMTVKIIDSSDNMRTFPNTEMFAMDRLLYKTRTVYDAVLHLIRSIEETDGFKSPTALREVSQILPLETLIKMSQIIDGIEKHSDTQMKHLITREFVVYDFGEQIRFFGMEDRTYVQKFMRAWEKLPGKEQRSVTRYDGNIVDHEVSLETIQYLRSLLPLIAKGAVQELEEKIDNISKINSGRMNSGSGKSSESVSSANTKTRASSPLSALARVRMASLL